jgi:nucleotidyltransferase/DNA polymerase involved in DNA repair
MSKYCIHGYEDWLDLLTDYFEIPSEYNSVNQWMRYFRMIRSIEFQQKVISQITKDIKKGFKQLSESAEETLKESAYFEDSKIKPEQVKEILEKLKQELASSDLFEVLAFSVEDPYTLEGSTESWYDRLACIFKRFGCSVVVQPIDSYEGMEVDGVVVSIKPLSAKAINSITD